MHKNLSRQFQSNVLPHLVHVRDGVRACIQVRACVQLCACVQVCECVQVRACVLVCVKSHAESHPQWSNWTGNFIDQTATKKGEFFFKLNLLSVSISIRRLPTLRLDLFLL